MKIIAIVSFFFLLGFIPDSQAKSSPHTPDPGQSVENRRSLKLEMSTMIEELSNLDRASKGSNMFENDLNKKQAQRILKGVSRINDLDQRGIYKDNLSELEKFTKELIRQIEKGNPNIRPYSEQVYNTCFSCHVQHRQDVTSASSLQGSYDGN